MSACTPVKNATPEQMAMLHRIADRQVTCNDTEDCKKKMARAIEWIKAHNKIELSYYGYQSYEITKISPSIIRTRGLYFKEEGSFPAFRILRYRREDGRYNIDFTTMCDTMTCTPSGLGLRASFVNTLIGPPPGVAEVAPDKFNYSNPQ
jgi:hypothetical protein